MTEDRILTEPEDWRVSVSKEDLRILLNAYALLLEVVPAAGGASFNGGEVTSLGGNAP